jgi:hypothetical protein
MKRKLFYFILLGCAVSFVQCGDDDAPAAPSCFPTELPAEEGVLKVTYNHLDHPEDLVLISDDEPEGDYNFKLEYDTERRLSKINYFSHDVLESYTTFERTGSTIIEHAFYKNGEGLFEEYERFVYYLTNDRITSRTVNDPFLSFATTDSIVYTYSDDNITQIDYYNENLDYVYKAEITYDDKINPYHVSGLNDSDNEFFTVANLSKNNPTKMKWIAASWTEEDTYEYTYDAEGKPITRKASYELEVRDIIWSCK